MLVTALKGMFVGATMLVPGVSGGSMAMILGEYDNLIMSVSSFFKHKKESIFYLGTFSLGAIIGMILFANPLLYAIEKYPMPLLYFFLGTVAGGIPLMYRKAEVKGFSVKSLLYLAIGIGCVILMTLFPQEGIGLGQEKGNYFIILAAGILVAIALVLPGISVSFMLLIMGIYETVIQAIGSFDIRTLLPLGIGVFLGVVLTTKLLEMAMKKYPHPTYLMILGFVLGSVPELFPGIPTGIEWLICPLTAIAGYFLIRLISRYEN